MPAREPLVDALRGAAVIGVVLVNAAGYSNFPDTLHVVPPPVPAGSWPAIVAQGLLLTVLQAKAWPLLSFLFGWSFAQSMRARGSGARAHRRRWLWRLLLIGLLHGALVYAGDVLTAYALTGFLLLPLARWRLRRLRRLWFVLFAGAVASAGLQALALHELIAVARTDPGVLASGPGYGSAASLLEHVGLSLPAYLWTQLLLTPFIAFSLLWLMVSGLIVGRLRGLSRPRWQTAWAWHARWALPVGLLLNAAVAVIMLRGGTTVEQPPSLWSAAHGLVGPLLSFGFLAWAASRRPAPLMALAPAGRRSLSVYLGSSLAFLIMLGGAGLGWGPLLGSVSTLVVSMVMAAVLVLGVTWAERMGRRGWLERWMSS